jgi:hypothetical protein
MTTSDVYNKAYNSGGRTAIGFIWYSYEDTNGSIRTTGSITMNFHDSTERNLARMKQVEAFTNFKFWNMSVEGVEYRSRGIKIEAFPGIPI